MQKVFWKVPENNKVSIKPKDKNLIFCPQCYRQKLQFNTLKEAESYMKWNSEEISEDNGKAPIRAYWCNCCCCYHVTSRMSQIKEDPKREQILMFLQKAITSDSIESSRGYIKESYEIITSINRDVPWINEVAGKILLVIDEINKKEFDQHVKKAEYLLRLRDWSSSEVIIKWLEDHNMNPEKVGSLRKKLMNSI